MSTLEVIHSQLKYGIKCPSPSREVYNEDFYVEACYRVQELKKALNGPQRESMQRNLVQLGKNLSAFRHNSENRKTGLSKEIDEVAKKAEIPEGLLMFLELGLGSPEEFAYHIDGWLLALGVEQEDFPTYRELIPLPVRQRVSVEKEQILNGEIH